MAERWLVIDDSATIQRVIKLAFQDYDVAITEADSCQEALRELSRSAASLVIADAALAGVQSVSDFSRLQQTSPQSAFVILEGSYDHIDEAQFRSAGFQHFLKKPFDAAQLIAVTRQALGRTIPHRFETEEEDEDAAPASGFAAAQQQGAKAFGASPAAASAFGRSDDAREQTKTQIAAAPGLSVPPVPPSPALGRPLVEESFDLGFEDSTNAAKAQEYHPQYAQPQGSATAKAGGFTLADENALERGMEPEAYAASPLNGMLEPMLREEMTRLVRQTVEEYCRKHFAEIAREYLGREIDRLSQERSRLLVDK